VTGASPADGPAQASTLGAMTRTWDDTGSAVQLAEACPACESAEVSERERDWFVLELDRGDEVRRESGDVDVEFFCRACGLHWR